MNVYTIQNLIQTVVRTMLVMELHVGISVVERHGITTGIAWLAGVNIIKHSIQHIVHHDRQTRRDTSRTGIRVSTSGRPAGGHRGCI